MKRFLISWAVLFVVWMLGSFVVHGFVIGDDYARLPNLFRPEADAQRYFPVMLLAHVIVAGAFAWIYSRGVEATPWLPQGLRFGVAVALLTIVPTYLIYFAVQPLPPALVAKQIVFDSILMLVLGIVVAWLHRTPADVRRR